MTLPRAWTASICPGSLMSAARRRPRTLLAITPGAAEDAVR